MCHAVGGGEAVSAAMCPIPRGPIPEAGWLSGSATAPLPAIDDLPYTELTTSGRAAISRALRALQLAPGSRVLVPTYHCPTMVAAVVHAGLVPVFYAQDAALRPLLAGLDADAVGALLVAHYFGHPRSLAAERAWCDQLGVALIEDCAHSFFGQAGERQVGAWGDFSIASVTKFFAVPEAGLLASATRKPNTPPQRPQGWRAQALALPRLLSLARHHGRLRLGAPPAPPAPAFVTAPANAAPAPAEAAHAADPLQGCDMRRTDCQPLALSRWVLQRSARAKLVERRWLNARFLQQRALPAGARWLIDLDRAGPESTAAPYAVPLWLDTPDAAYQALRRNGVPVFRWDALWQGTPADLVGDHGFASSRHVLQLLCHQSLGDTELAHIGRTLDRVLKESVT
jgi:hypothetical protein